MLSSAFIIILTLLAALIVAPLTQPIDLSLAPSCRRADVVVAECRQTLLTLEKPNHGAFFSWLTSVGFTWPLAR